MQQTGTAGTAGSAHQTPPGFAARRLDYLTAAEVEAYLARSDAALLPVGPTEAHGVHLPLACDVLVAQAACALAAERADALILPPFSYSWPGGTSSLPGTIPVNPELVMPVLTAIAQGAMGKGFRRLVFVSAHDPDALTATLAARRLYESTGVPVVSYSVARARNSTPPLREAAGPLLDLEREEPGGYETSLLAGALRVLGMESAAPVRMDLPPREPVPLLEGDRTINRLGGATVGRYFSDLSQHIPKPRTLLVEDAIRYLEAVAATIAAALEALRDYAGPAGELAGRTGLR